MTVSDTLTNLMNASRRVYDGHDKRSLADLTTLMLNPSSAYSIIDSSTAEITSQGLVMSNVDGATLLTTQGNDDHRILFPVGNNASVSDQMTLVMIARRSPKASAGTISMRIGGYDNWTALTITSIDWKLYRVPLKNSDSPYCSIYANQLGSTIEYKYFALIKVGGVIKPNLLPNYIKLTTDWYVPNPLIKDSEGVNELQLVPNSTNKTSASPTRLNCANTYTWEFWARAENNGDMVHTELWGGGGHADIPLTTDWKKYQSQGKPKQYQALYFWGLDSNKGSVYVKLPYLYKD